MMVMRENRIEALLRMEMEETELAGSTGVGGVNESKRAVPRGYRGAIFREVVLAKMEEIRLRKRAHIL